MNHMILLILSEPQLAFTTLLPKHTHTSPLGFSSAGSSVEKFILFSFSWEQKNSAKRPPSNHPQQHHSNRIAVCWNPLEDLSIMISFPLRASLTLSSDVKIVKFYSILFVYSIIKYISVIYKFFSKFYSILFQNEIFQLFSKFISKFYSISKWSISVIFQVPFKVLFYFIIFQASYITSA